MTRLHLRVRQRGHLARIRGIEIEAIEQAVTVSRVPGSQFGMALVRGQIVPVIRLGDANGCLIVGRIRGEAVGITGLEVLGFDSPEETRVEAIDPLAFPVDLDPMRTGMSSSDTSREDVPHESRREPAAISLNGLSRNDNRSEGVVDIDVEAIFDTLTQQQRHSPQPVEEQP